MYKYRYFKQKAFEESYANYAYTLLTVWGSTMVWSQDETKLAYLAEKKIAKAKPFFTSYSKIGGDSNANDEIGTEAKEVEDSAKVIFIISSIPTIE
jgi:hypothetical protein